MSPLSRGLRLLGGLLVFGMAGALVSWFTAQSLRTGLGIGVGFALFLILTTKFRQWWPPSPRDSLYPRGVPIVLAGALAGLSAALIRGAAPGWGALTGAFYAFAYAVVLWLERRTPVGPAA